MAAAVVLLIAYWGNELHRWAGLFLIAASLGGMIESLQQLGWAQTAHWLMLINLLVTPYAVLIFSLHYADRLPSSKKRIRIKGSLFIPIIVVFGITFLLTDYTSRVMILLCASPYYLAACMWFIIVWRRERQREYRRNHFIVVLVMVPTLLAVLLMIYVTRVLDPAFNFFPFIIWFIGYSFLLAVICVFLYGFMGLQLRVERESKASTMQAFSTGAGFLNHTLKNELGKMAIATENLRRLKQRGSTQQEQEQEQEQEQVQLGIISQATEHMQAMVSRIHNQLKDVRIVAEPCSLAELEQMITRAIQVYDSSLQQKHITVQWLETTEAAKATEAARSVYPTDHLTDKYIWLDPIHMQEIIHNLIANAIDAMPEGGRLTIQVEMYASKRLFRSETVTRITVQDTGCGMSQETIDRIWEPFYSTKSHSFGLGMAYVHNVLERMGGKLVIQSKLGAGTAMMIYLSNNSNDRDRSHRGKS